MGLCLVRIFILAGFTLNGVISVYLIDFADLNESSRRGDLRLSSIPGFEKKLIMVAKLLMNRLVGRMISL